MALVQMSSSSPALAATPSSDSVVAGAVARAKAEGKAVLVEFGASWCVWCRRFEAFVNAPASGDIVRKQFVIVNLTVQERDDKKALENPGADRAMVQWGGKEAGLPFYVFLDSDGTKIADSNAMPNGTNVGFPGNPEEVAVFVGMIGKAAPNLSRADRQTLSDVLTDGLKK